MFLTKKVYSSKKRKKASSVKRILSNSGSKSFSVILSKGSRNLTAYVLNCKTMNVEIAFSTSSKSFISEIEKKGIKNRVSKEAAFEFGVSLFGKLDKNQKIKSEISKQSVFFNRGPALFHGKVERFWEGFSSCLK